MSALLIRGAKSCLTLKPEPKNPLGITKNTDILIVDGQIHTVGNVADELIDSFAPKKMRGDKYIVLPGLIDCHTHLVFAGSRELEFSMRLEGKRYEDILKAGGGILSTVRETREASFETLYDIAKKRLESVMSHGVTTIEIKSGYGLNVESEIKILRVIAALKKEVPIDIFATFLGAHAFPLEYREDREAYVNLLIHEMIPQVAENKLADFCDIFCDGVAFSVEESEQILQVALGYGMGAKVHADQLSNSGGALLAARVGAVSAEHLHFVNIADMMALKKSKVVPVLLPGASFFLNDKEYANARAMIDVGLPVALATDFNPGSSMTENLPMVGTLAALKMNMTIDEVMMAMTLNAAKALGAVEAMGSVEVGKQGDLLLLEIPDYRYLFYHFATQHKKIVIKKGHIIYEN